MNKNNGYKYGIETEYLIVDKKTLTPLWHKELNFKELYSLIESIPFHDLPSLVGLDEEDAHERILPYVIEGYHLKDENNKAYDMLPKGIEIRTPVCHSLQEVLSCLDILFTRLQEKLNQKGLLPVALSHHPTEDHFYAPQANRRHDFWLWAMEAMLTFGPDINISFPKPISDRLFEDKASFESKLNYYAPALTALSLSSPFFKGGLRQDFHKNYTRSLRTFKRSTVAPAIEWHQNEDNRIEYKFFEMSDSLEDYYSYFLMCLAISLGDELKGKAMNQERVYLMGEVANLGLNSPNVHSILEDFFSHAPQILSRHGFDPKGLEPMKRRWLDQTTPADEMIESYLSKASLGDIFKSRSTLKKAQNGLC